MTEDCNTEALKIARGRVAQKNCPAHRKWIMEGRWDDWDAVQEELRCVLRGPQIMLED